MPSLALAAAAILRRLGVTPFVYADRVTERARRRLPIGVQTFRKIRETDAYYVDKTPRIERLVLEGNQYSLSRPRRFGKSVLVDTIKELFEGNGALFEAPARRAVIGQESLNRRADSDG